MTIRYSRSGVTGDVRGSASKCEASGHLSTVKHSTDIIYYNTTITINGAVLGSAFSISDYTNKLIIVSGIITSDPQDISIQANSLPMFYRLKLRKGTEAPKYLPYEVIGKVNRNALELFVIQIEDAIANG